MMKRAIIVGATTGIGRGLAEVLVKHQYRVGVTGRRDALLRELEQEHPGLCFASSFDVTETEVVVARLEELLSALGGLDLLIISSGTGDINDGLDFDIERQTIETNVTGFTCIANWAFNHFEKQGHGHLVGISSVGGLRGSRQAPAYNASKAWQINYLEGLRQKAFRLKGVYVTDIRPGLVDTAMAKGDGLFWVMPVEKTVLQIFRAIRRKRKVAYVTRRWRAIAILLSIMPRFVYDRM
jgi:short-subunit dehydrogenase